MRVRLLSRGSELARLQAALVGQVLRDRHPEVDIEMTVRSAAGDRDQRINLWQSPERGFFTSDLSRALLEGEADIAVHSWKDLPIEGREGTRVAGTLERADPRDVLLVTAETRADAPEVVEVLTSSPRRAHQLAESLPRLLPWRVTGVRPTPVRGNIPTRLDQLLQRRAHGLVVAKAALDRLLSPPSEVGTVERIRTALARCWSMVLPLREFPTAPAQGALALEIASHRMDLHDMVQSISHGPTRRAVDAERAILSGHGGGCHEAVGATVLERPECVVTSVRGRTPSGERLAVWSTVPSTTGGRGVESSRAAAVWVDGSQPPGRPSLVTCSLVSTDDSSTWARLAHRGIWVHGCADGLDEPELPAIDAIAGRRVTWRPITEADLLEQEPWSRPACR